MMCYCKRLKNCWILWNWWHWSPLLRGNFNCEFWEKSVKEEQEKMKQCSAGAAAGIDLCLELLCTAEERVFCCSSSRDKMYSAVVRVGRFNRWLLLLLLLGFRIPELNWSLQRPCCHTALQCTASLGAHHLCQPLQVQCKVDEWSTAV